MYANILCTEHVKIVAISLVAIFLWGICLARIYFTAIERAAALTGCLAGSLTR